MRILKNASLVGLGAVAALSANAQPSFASGVSFEHPILQEAHVSAPFGMRSDPFTKRPGWHGGIDLGADWDAQVFAPAKGQILFAGKKPGYGNMVDLKVSDDSVLRFAHMKSISVKTGDMLEPGHVIGLVGSVAVSSGPHLHLEARVDGKQYDPNSIEALQLYASER